MNFSVFSRLFILVSCILFVSCVRQKSGITQEIKNNKPIFIAMPQSSFSFENITPQVYTALVQQFRRMGYYLVSSVQESDYSLVTTINDLSFMRRYISPDVLLFNYSLKLDLSCLLYDGSKKLIKEKKFIVSTLVSKAKSPILNSSFFAFESKKLYLSVSSQIELYFRSYLLK